MVKRKLDFLFFIFYNTTMNKQIKELVKLLQKYNVPIAGNEGTGVNLRIYPYADYPARGVFIVSNIDLSIMWYWIDLKDEEWNFTEEYYRFLLSDDYWMLKTRCKEDLIKE